MNLSMAALFFYYICLSFICRHPKRLPPIKSFFSLIFTICQLTLTFFHTKWVRQQGESTGNSLNIEKHTLFSSQAPQGKRHLICLSYRLRSSERWQFVTPCWFNKTFRLSMTSTVSTPSFLSSTKACHWRPRQLTREWALLSLALHPYY